MPLLALMPHKKLYQSRTKAFHAFWQLAEMLLFCKYNFNTMKKEAVPVQETASFIGAGILTVLYAL